MRAAYIVALALLASSARGESSADSHHLKARISLQDSFNYYRADSAATLQDGRAQNQELGSLRIMYAEDWRSWSIDAHYLLAFEQGSGIYGARQAAAASTPPATWLDLTDSLAARPRWSGQQGIDRLSIGYSAPGFVIRVGRQALSWGAGQIFRPMDIVNSFGPSAIDTEFKPGTEMLYGQLLFSDGSDVQGIIVPRSTTLNGRPTSPASTFAAHVRWRIAGLQMTFLAARDHGDWTGAVAANGSFGGATWNLEFVPTRVNTGDTYLSALANVSSATTVLGRNTRLFGEYFHNGFGVAGQPFVASLPRYLTDRLSRGQAFVATRDFVALGAIVECSPLLTFAPTAIADLHGRSLYLLAAANWSLSDSSVLVAGLQKSVGRRGSEFGGISLSPQSPLTSDIPSRAYLQLRIYF